MLAVCSACRPAFCRALLFCGYPPKTADFCLSYAVCPAFCRALLFCGCPPKTAGYCLFYTVRPAFCGLCCFCVYPPKTARYCLSYAVRPAFCRALLFCNPPVKTGVPILCRNARPDSRWSYRNNRPASSGYAPEWSACRFHSSRMSFGVRQGILPARTGWRSVLPAGL